jgi:hypothetical protein
LDHGAFLGQRRQGLIISEEPFEPVADAAAVPRMIESDLDFVAYEQKRGA